MPGRPGYISKVAEISHKSTQKSWKFVGWACIRPVGLGKKIRRIGMEMLKIRNAIGKPHNMSGYPYEPGKILIFS
jgi:hypothetical protein